MIMLGHVIEGLDNKQQLHNHKVFKCDVIMVRHWQLNLCLTS